MTYNKNDPCKSDHWVSWVRKYSCTVFGKKEKLRSFHDWMMMNFVAVTRRHGPIEERHSEMWKETFSQQPFRLLEEISLKTIMAQLHHLLQEASLVSSLSDTMVLCTIRPANICPCVPGRLLINEARCRCSLLHWTRSVRQKTSCTLIRNQDCEALLSKQRAAAGFNPPEAKKWCSASTVMHCRFCAAITMGKVQDRSWQCCLCDSAAFPGLTIHVKCRFHQELHLCVV